METYGLKTTLLTSTIISFRLNYKSF